MICFCFIVLTRLKHPVQIDRLVTVAILPSIFVCLYGILQHFHLDPIHWATDTSFRVLTTLGNPVYSAAYIAMIFPLTALRLLQSIQKLFQDQIKQPVSILRFVLYLLITLLQISLIFFSQSRGPFLGLVVSTIFLFFAFIYYFQKRLLLYICLLVTGILVAILITLNLVFPGANRLLSSVSPSRIVQLLNPNTHDEGSLRTLYWQDTARLVLPHDPIQYSNREKDELNFIRPLIGYGLESLTYTYPRFYSPAVTEAESSYTPTDRAHNQVWDLLATGGLVALILYQSLIFSLFYGYLKWAGAFPDRRKQMIYGLLSLGGGLGISLALCLWQRLELVGVALPAGFSTGFLLYLLFISLSNKNQTNIQKPGWDQFLISTACLAAILGHYIEITFGFEISATQIFFWLFTAILLSTITVPRSEQAGPENMGRPLLTSGSKQNKKRQGSDIIATFQPWVSPQTATSAGIVLALLLVTIAYSFLANSGGSSRPWDILNNSMLRLSAAAATQSYALLVILGIVIIIGPGLLIEPASPGAPPLNRFLPYLKALGLAVMLCCPYWLWRAFDLAGQVMPAPVDLNTAIEIFVHSDQQIIVYSIVILLLVLLLSLALFINQGEASGRPKPLSIVLLPLTLLLAMAATYQLNLKPIQADIDFRNGKMLSSNQNWQLALPLLERSIQLAPYEDYYAINTANTLIEQASANQQDATLFQQLMDKAEKILLFTSQKTPVDPLPLTSLADLYAHWTQQSGFQSVTENDARRAETLYKTALTLSPSDDRLWFNLAVLNVYLFNQTDLAQQQLNKTLYLNPASEDAYGLFGYIYYQQAQKSATPGKRNDLLEQSADNYRKARIISGDKLEYLIPLANTYVDLQQYNEAYHCYESALPLATDGNRWQIYYSLSHLSFELDDKTSASEFARKALAEAPPEVQSEINDFLTQIIKALH